jgi:hypothetical protein
MSSSFPSRRLSSVLRSSPASPSASHATPDEAKFAPSLKMSKSPSSGAVCSDISPSLRFSLRATSFFGLQLQQQEHGGKMNQLRQRLCKQQSAPPNCRKMQRHLIHHRLQPRPLVHENCAPRLCSSNKRCWTGAVIAFVALCLSCFINVAAAQEFACPGAWSNAALKQSRHSLAAASLPNQGLSIFAGGVSGSGTATFYFNSVDMFNASSGLWSTAILRAARSSLAATSLPDQGLVMLAGGRQINIMSVGFSGLLFAYLIDDVSCCVCRRAGNVVDV